VEAFENLSTINGSFLSLYQKRNVKDLPGHSLDVKMMHRFFDLLNKDFPEILDDVATSVANALCGSSIEFNIKDQILTDEILRFIIVIPESGLLQ